MNVTISLKIIKISVYVAIYYCEFSSVISLRIHHGVQNGENFVSHHNGIIKVICHRKYSVLPFTNDCTWKYFVCSLIGYSVNC